MEDRLKNKVKNGLENTVENGMKNKMEAGGKKINQEVTEIIQTTQERGLSFVTLSEETDQRQGKQHVKNVL